jgi:hypothetical protein
MNHLTAGWLRLGLPFFIYHCLLPPSTLFAVKAYFNSLALNLAGYARFLALCGTGNPCCWRLVYLKFLWQSFENPHFA